MKKSIVGVLAALVAGLVVLLPSASAHAADDPYPDVVCNLAVSATSVVGGEEVTITVTSDVRADLAIAFLGDTRSADDVTELVETFRTPVVDQREVAPVLGSCGEIIRDTGVELLPTGADAVGGDGAGSDGVADGGESPIAGILPSTGGPAFWLLLLGVLLVLGGVAVVAQRRRA